MTGGVFGPEGATSDELEPEEIDSARAGLLWSKPFSAELTAKGFEQC